MKYLNTLLRRGFSLIELLIVVGIISLLLQLILPAIQNSREAARRAHCNNNLRQISLAFQLHHGVHGYYPSSGWGWLWVGHPDRGYGKDQPGGWAYNLLPFIEQQAIRDLGSGFGDGTREQQQLIYMANSIPIPLFNCPSRRQSDTFPMVSGYIQPVFAPLLTDECREGDGEKCRVARSDYAVNAGSKNPGGETGPKSLAEADDWPWQYSGSEGKEQNGISHQRSLVRMAEVTDGLSKTYCVGEKYVPVADYDTGKYWNDDLTIFIGHDGDMNRFTVDEPHVRTIGCDTDPVGNQQFGSAHREIFHMSNCDGSVRPISYEIDLDTHRLLGGRNDGYVGD